MELLPSDSHYYTRFARLQLHAFPRYQTFDPYVSFPEGAQIILPPLHAELVAAAVKAAGPEEAELGAAWVGPALSVTWLAALLGLAWAVMGAGPSLVLAALLGLTPVLVDAGALGNADHHLHEGFLGAAVPLAVMAMIRAPAWRTAALVGVLVGVGRLLAPSAFMFVPCAAVAAALAGWWRPEDQGYARAVGWAGVIAAGIGLVSAVAFGSVRSLEYEEVSAFHPLLALACFGAAFGVAALARARRAPKPEEVGARRFGAVAGPIAALAGSVVVGLALVRPMRGALSHLGRADPLLALVTESEPLWRDPKWAVQLLGTVLLVLPLGLFLGFRHVRRNDIPLLAPLCLVVPLLGAAAMQARFAPALAGSAAVLVAECFALIDRPVLRRVVAAVGAVPLALSLLPPAKQIPPADVRLVRPTMLWMRDHLPRASADPYDGQKASYGVVASYLLGHTLPLWSERPAEATLFS
ncbi:MAG TPA: peptide transporter, partial [Myxococcales bacterium]|nr:peptide transporter [Myxococcales bacterium]